LDLSPGEKVSYGGTYTASKPMRIGVLPLGYYEGVPRSLSNCGEMSSGAHRLPIVGRVCMDHVMIDLANSDLKVGDEVVVVSRDNSRRNSVQGLQEHYDLFAYETLTRLSDSVRRVIV
jgi:alanine racemase